MIIRSLCKLYGVRQSLTCPYNPRGNAQCERFNRTMFRLLHMLSKDQKADWPLHLPSLVFAYNVTPHSTTGFQPYQLMFGRKVLAPCDAWLGLGVYNDDKSTNKVQWVNQNAEQLLAANKRAMKNKAAEAKNKRSVGGGRRSIFHRCYSGIILGVVIRFRTNTNPISSGLLNEVKDLTIFGSNQSDLTVHPER